MLQNMPEDHRIEILFGEMALLQRLGIDSKSLGLGCSPGRQRRALNAVALVSQLCKLVKQQSSAAADLKNSASSFPSRREHVRLCSESSTRQTLPRPERT